MEWRPSISHFERKISCFDARSHYRRRFDRHAYRKGVDRAGDDITFFDFAPKSDYIRRVTGRNVTVIRGDIRDLAALIEAFQQTRAECVLHLAASVGEANINNVYAGFQVNLVGTINVAEAARHHRCSAAGPCKHASTVCE